MTGRLLYLELEALDDWLSHVDQLYENNRFPDGTHLPLGELMKHYWQGSFNCMSEVFRELEASSPSSLKLKF